MVRVEGFLGNKNKIKIEKEKREMGGRKWEKSEKREKGSCWWVHRGRRREEEKMEGQKNEKIKLN